MSTVLIFGLYLAVSAVNDVAAWALAVMWVCWRILRRREIVAIPQSLLRICVIPVLLLLLAMPGALFHPMRDVLRDLWYFTNPIVFIAFGYVLFEEIESWQAFLQPLIAIGLVASVYSAVNDFLNREVILLSSSTDAIHLATGRFGQAMIPMVLILLARKVGLPAGRLDGRKALRIALYTLGSLAIIISFSRTLISVLSVGLLFSVRYKGLGTRMLRSKGVGALGFAAALGTVIFVAASSASLLSSSFFDKFANTADEVKFRHYDSFQEISDNWRGFEAYRGFQTYDGYSPREQVMGAGLGALVDLGFSMQLTPTESMRFIPIVHNGYTYLLVKTGVIGIMLFAIFVLQIGWLGVRMLRRTDPTRIFVGYLLLWTAIDFALTQGVITGIYNRSALAPNLILLGAAVASLRQRDMLEAEGELDVFVPAITAQRAVTSRMPHALA